MTSKVKDKETLVKKVAEKLLKLLGSEPKVKVSEDKENKAVLVEIETEKDTGLLIGRKGETLKSIQTIIGMMLYKNTGEWTRVIVNIGDWREKQEEYLTRIANQAIEKVIETGEPQSLYNLDASQRRIIHLEVANNKEVETESVGEGKERYLVVKLRK
jgi:spoIIIJ-associated protein